MNKLIISLGLILTISLTTIVANAESTIYTDGIGRMHFLGRDAANSTGVNNNYSNSAEKDLTRRLYEKSVDQINNDTSYDQHPLKNYENTFPDSRFNTAKYWSTKYSNNVDNATVKAKATVEKIDAENVYYNNYNKESTAKKHWWNRK